MADSKVSITISRKANGINPPLFVAGSFSSPEWVPELMDHTTAEDGEPIFTKTFQVAPNAKIQYKFRVGESDWWVLNDDAPTVTDDAGNKNNILEAPALEQYTDDPAEYSETITSEQTQAPIEQTPEDIHDHTAESNVPDEATEKAAEELPALSHSQESANTAAEVADTAATLDTDAPEIHLEEPPPEYKVLADVKAEITDGNLEIASHSNGPDSAPLFAHECAGLYEDDEIPGADDIGGPTKSNGQIHGHSREDFDDPTLEKFPSTKEEIISAVRKVETGLNEDHTSVSGVPPSPMFHPVDAGIANIRSNLNDRDENPAYHGQIYNLIVPQSPTQQSLGARSLSAVSLGSIDEGLEGEEEKSKNAEIEPSVEQADTVDNTLEFAKENGHGSSLTAPKPGLEPLITVPSPSTKADAGLLSPTSDEDEAVVLKSAKGKDKSTESGYLTPERAATPIPEELGSPREPPPNTSDPVYEPDSQVEDPETEFSAITSVPKSPQIVVSKVDDNHSEEDLLPAPSISDNDPNHQDNRQTDINDSSKDDEASKHSEPSSHENRQDGSRTETVASSTAIEENQAASLKKRSAAQNNPIDRTGTPKSITDAGRDVGKSGSWISAFFRLIFIELVGGFVRRLFGGRRKTLITTVALLAAMGYVSYRKAKHTDILAG